jgi:hypothetical protein
VISLERIIRILLHHMARAAGITSSSTRGEAGARSVVTSVGRGLRSSSPVKNRRVAARSRFPDIGHRRPGRTGQVPDTDTPIARRPSQKSRPRTSDHRGVPAWPCCANQQRAEPLYPTEDCDVVDRDATFGQSLFDVVVGQAVAQLPGHPHHDHIWRAPEVREAGPRQWPSNLHRTAPRHLIRKRQRPALPNRY